MSRSGMRRLYESVHRLVARVYRQEDLPKKDTPNMRSMIKTRSAVPSSSSAVGLDWGSFPAALLMM